MVVLSLHHLIYLMGLNLGKGTTWIICLAEVLDIHSPPKKEITKSTRGYDLLLEKVTCN